MSESVVELITTVVVPVVTGVLGWVSSAYRNRQQKEKNILDNVKQLLDMKSEEVERSRVIADRQNYVIQRIEAKLDKKDKAIRKSRACAWVKQGNDCPVIEADDAYESGEETKAKSGGCSGCELNKDCDRDDKSFD